MQVVTDAPDDVGPTSDPTADAPASLQPQAHRVPAPRAGSVRWWPPSEPVVRLVALGVLIVLAVVTAVVLVSSRQAPTIEELRRRAGWQDLQTLTVGVSGDVPGVSECPPGRACTGFDVEIAKLVADWLGVPRSNVEFYEVLPENRYRMLGTRQGTPTAVHLDMVVAGFSITTERIEKDKVVFAGPYLTTETTVLTRRDHPPVASLVGLDDPIQDGTSRRRQRVCTPGTSTSAHYLQQEVKTAEIVPMQRNSECVAKLRSGEVDAAVTDAAILAGFAARYPRELRLNNIASAVDENWGIGLGRDFTGTDRKLQARRQLVLLALEDLRSTPRQEAWSQAFTQLPRTTAEPGQQVQVVADDHQPLPRGLEPVRRWPWEHTGTGSGG